MRQKIQSITLEKYIERIIGISNLINLVTLLANFLSFNIVVRALELLYSKPLIEHNGK